MQGRAGLVNGSDDQGRQGASESSVGGSLDPKHLRRRVSVVEESVGEPGATLYYALSGQRHIIVKNRIGKCVLVVQHGRITDVVISQRLAARSVQGRHQQTRKHQNAAHGPATMESPLAESIGHSSNVECRRCSVHAAFYRHRAESTASVITLHRSIVASDSGFLF